MGLEFKPVLEAMVGAIAALATVFAFTILFRWLLPISVSVRVIQDDSYKDYFKAPFSAFNISIVVNTEHKFPFIYKEGRINVNLFDPEEKLGINLGKVPGMRGLYTLGSKDILVTSSNLFKVECCPKNFLFKDYKIEIFVSGIVSAKQVITFNPTNV